MKIEHVALLVTDPMQMASWYERTLGMKTMRALGAPSFTHFLADAAETMLIEIYRNDHLPVPDYQSFDPLLLHLAFSTDRIEADRARLIAAGAKPEGDVTISPRGDRLAMLRDPWGLAIQLVHRREPML